MKTRDDRIRELREDLGAWHRDRLFSIERTVRLLRLQALLEDGDGEIGDHPRPVLHLDRAWLDQTSLWPTSSVTQLYRHPDVYAWVIERLEFDQLGLRERQDRAHSLLRRCSELRLPAVAGPEAEDPAPADRLRVSRSAAMWESELGRAIEVHGLIRLAYGTCLRCAVVRPVADLHVLRSSAIPVPLYVCAGREPPPDRLGLSLDDHWGSPCSCRVCRASLASIGMDPLIDEWLAIGPGVAAPR